MNEPTNRELMKLAYSGAHDAADMLDKVWWGNKFSVPVADLERMERRLTEAGCAINELLNRARGTEGRRG